MLDTLLGHQGFDNIKHFVDMFIHRTTAARLLEQSAADRRVTLYLPPLLNPGFIHVSERQIFQIEICCDITESNIIHFNTVLRSDAGFP